MGIGFGIPHPDGLRGLTAERNLNPVHLIHRRVSGRRPTPRDHQRIRHKPHVHQVVLH